MAKTELPEKLKKIKIPVLVIAGIQDPVTTVADGQFMAERIVGSQLFEINASHISNIEQPKVFNTVIQKFIVS